MTAWVHSAITSRRGLVKTETRPRASNALLRELGRIATKPKLIKEGIS